MTRAGNHGVDKIVLPEPVRSLYRRARSKILLFLEERFEEPYSPRVAGSTILAARWQHRDSSDLDLILPKGSGIASVFPEWDRTLVDLGQEAGTTKYIVRTDDVGLEFREGRIEITELESSLHDGFEWKEIERSPERVQDNDQILAGKIVGRGLLRQSVQRSPRIARVNSTISVTDVSDQPRLAVVVETERVGNAVLARDAASVRLGCGRRRGQSGCE